MSSSDAETQPRSLNQILTYVQSFLGPRQPAHPRASVPTSIPFGSPFLSSTPTASVDMADMADVPSPPSPPGYDGSSKLMVKRIASTARLPVRGSKFSAGYDLTSSECIRIPAGGRHLISTGLTIAVPSGTYGRVAPRSGLAVKKGICVGAGVIDEDYRGVVKILLFNHGDEDYWVNTGDRIAQLILEKIETPEVVEIDELDESERGAGGFGSTGN